MTFQAIHRADYEALRMLAKTFVETRHDLAVLCLDHVFSHPFELQGLTMFETQELLSLYLDYIRLLTKFLHDESLPNNLDKQRLFGFQALGWERWLVLRDTVLYEGLTGTSDSSGRGGDGYICGHDELRRGIRVVIEDRISTRTWAEDRACRQIHGFSPCLRLLIQGECDPLCSFRHIQPEHIDLYHARLHLILLQFEILYTTGYSSGAVTYAWFFCNEPVRMLISCKGTGLGYYTQHSTRLLTGSGRLRTLTSPASPKRQTVSGLYRKWFETPVIDQLTTPLRNHRTPLGNGSLLRAH